MMSEAIVYEKGPMTMSPSPLFPRGRGGDSSGLKGEFPTETMIIIVAVLLTWVEPRRCLRALSNSTCELRFLLCLSSRGDAKNVKSLQLHNVFLEK